MLECGPLCNGNQVLLILNPHSPLQHVDIPLQLGVSLKLKSPLFVREGLARPPSWRVTQTLAISRNLPEVSGTALVQTRTGGREKGKGRDGTGHCTLDALSELLPPQGWPNKGAARALRGCRESAVTGHRETRRLHSVQLLHPISMLCDHHFAAFKSSQ